MLRNPRTVGIAVAICLGLFVQSANSQGENVKPPFRLEADTDFMFHRVIITPAHVDAMMARLREMGVTRASWSVYGDGRGGYFMPSPSDLCGINWKNYADTYRVLGGNSLRVAVEAAHRHGIELYAYYKPYENAIELVLPDGSPEGRAFGRIRKKGGWLTWLDPFVVEHPHLRIRHRPDDSIKDLSDVPICALKLVKRDDSPTRVTGEHLQIWSSQLNYRYKPLAVDLTVHEAVEPSPKEVRDLNGAVVTKKGDPVRTLTLSGFRLTDPYILVTTDFTNGPADFENTGTDMLTALDEQGNEIPGVFATGGTIYYPERVDFRSWGLPFDYGYGRRVIGLDVPNASGHAGLIAFTRGRNEYLGALCETEPEVRDFWLSCIRDMLDAGVDGVDFRVQNHSTFTDYYEEYGFNEVVLEECARRGNTDAETVAQVRGEAYTEFLRRAKRLIASRGKRMRINLNVQWFRPDPPPSLRLGFTSNIHYDWRRWVDEGLLDEAIMRGMPPIGFENDAVSCEMIARCEEKGIPLTVNRNINSNYAAEFTRLREDGRFSGFIIYGTGHCIRFDEEGGCYFETDPALIAQYPFLAGFSDYVAEVCRLMKGSTAGSGPSPPPKGP